MAISLGGEGRLVGGRYILEAPIGRGGMGEVWRARHATLASPVAIKFLHAASAESPSSRRRFLTEAQVTANLKTKHAVQVFDFGVTDDGLPFLVMELLEGETLERRIARQGRLSIEETARILQKAARALDRAHQLGIVHRDFKPENVMLVDDTEDGGDGAQEVKVVDFGVAKLVRGSMASLPGRAAPDESLAGALESSAGARGRSPSSMSVTSTGLGTPFYMAPEQVQAAADVGPAADIWAFGVVAYECLTGRRPFRGDTVGELLVRILTAIPPPPASAIAGVPAAFDAWFATACAREPTRRFRDVAAAAAALCAALTPSVEHTPPSIDLTLSPIEEMVPSPRAESLLPASPPSIGRASDGGAERPTGAAIVGGQTISTRGAPARASRRRLSRRVVVAAVAALAALFLALRSAPSPPAAPAAGPALVPLARANEAPDAPEAADPRCAADPPAPASTGEACPAVHLAPAPPASTGDPTAPHRTRAARPAHRLPPLGL